MTGLSQLPRKVVSISFVYGFKRLKNSAFLFLCHLK